MKTNKSCGRRFDPRRLHHKNGLLTGLESNFKPYKWSLSVNTGTVYAALNDNIKDDVS